MNLLVAALLTAPVPCHASDSIEALLDDPNAALRFDYCNWRFVDGGSVEHLPDFEADGRNPRATALAEAGTTIALAAQHPRACRKVFKSGSKAHDKASSKALGRLRPRTGLSDDPEIAAVQSEVNDLFRRDQAARQVYIGSQTDDTSGSEFWARRLAYSLATDADNQSTAFMLKTIEQYDWIDTHRFGEKTAHQAWLLVQHADDYPDLQRTVLARMEPYLADGGVSKQDYAYLWDRVAVNRGEKQRYGTQPDWECKDGKLVLMPLEDPEHVDTRRAEMGLGPVQQALAQMSLSVCGTKNR